MEKSGKKRSGASSGLKTAEPVRPYSIPENQVVVLTVGSEKKHRITLGGLNPHNVVQDWYDIYENKKVEDAVRPFHYHSKMELVELAREGVSAGVIERLAELLKITKKQASAFFHFSERTLNDYIKKDKILDTDSSEKILKIFSLYLFGLSVFRGSNGFINWLTKPAFGLKNKIPMDLFSSSDGIDLIQEELSRIEYGDFS